MGSKRSEGSEGSEPPGLGAVRTRRQQLRELLRMGAFSFEDLRRALAVPVKLLEEDLHHLARSARADGERLVAEPPSCVACGFRFERRAQRRFSRPGRCPRCRSSRICHTVLHLEAIS